MTRESPVCGLGGIRLPGIYEVVLGGNGREAAERVLAERRRLETERLLAGGGS